MNIDDDDLVFPWEEGAPPAKPTVNFGVASNPEARPTARKARRSSILKPSSVDFGFDRTVLQVAHLIVGFVIKSGLHVSNCPQVYSGSTLPF